jgi:hypothetical protein
MKLLINPTKQEFCFVIPKMDPTEGTQKVRGFSRGHHMNNSVRLGIRKENDYIVFSNYSHINKETINVRIAGQWKEGRIAHAVLTFEKDKTTVSVGYVGCLKYRADVNFKQMKTCSIGYVLNPYAEEDEPSNREIDFPITFLPLIYTKLKQQQNVGID